MSEIRIPVFDDKNRSHLMGMATIDDDQITIVVKNEECVNACSDLVRVHMIRAFLLGFQYIKGANVNMTKLDSQKCPNGHPCDNNGQCRQDGCAHRKPKGQ